MTTGVAAVAACRLTKRTQSTLCWRTVHCTHTWLPIKNRGPSYPVDDFGLKGTDDAAVVEDRMFLIQFFKGCSCLRAEEKHAVILGQSTVHSVFVSNRVMLTSSWKSRPTAVGPELKNVNGWNNNRECRSSFLIWKCAELAKHMSSGWKYTDANLHVVWFFLKIQNYCMLFEHKSTMNI